MAARIKLGELCHVVTKGTTPTSLGMSFADEGVPFLRIQNLRGSEVKLDDVLYIDNEVHQSLSRSIIKPKDFLITIAGTIGRVAIVPDEFPECNCNQAIAILRFDNERLDARWLYHWLSTSDAMGQIAGKKVTATISNLSLGQIKDLGLPLPYPDDPEKSLKEQKRIAAILDKADGIRHKRQQAIQLADDFLRSVFLDMFGDPVTNPKGWEVKTAKEILFIQGGYAFKSTNFVKSGIPVVKIGNANKDGFVTKKFDFVEEDSSGKLKNYELRTGDLLMSLTGTVGKDDYGNITEVNDSYPMYYLNQRVAKIGFDNKLTTRTYLKFYFGLDRIKTELTKNNRGVRQANISNTDIYSLNIPTPDRIYLSKFEEIVVNIEKNIEKMSKSNESTDAFFNSLSQKAFKGEL